MTLTQVAMLAFVLTGILTLLVGELARTPRVRFAQRVLVALWVASGAGFIVETITVLAPIVRSLTS